MIEVTVNPAYRYSSVTAFGGKVFSKTTAKTLSDTYTDLVNDHMALTYNVILPHSTEPDQDIGTPDPVQPSLSELRYKARKAGIKGYARMKRATLIRKLGEINE